jgi:hypothetical protein
MARRGLPATPWWRPGAVGWSFLGTLAFRLDEAAGTFSEHVGTRVSIDGGRSFTAFGTAERIVTLLPNIEAPLDKEWLAVDATDGAFGGSAYLIWDHYRPDGTQDLVVSASRDGGRSYLPSLVLQHVRQRDLRGLVVQAQLAVRPNGNVIAVWKWLRRGQAVIQEAVSRDGGASFSRPRPVVRLGPSASQLDNLLSLAVSPRGRLALCWSHVRRRGAYKPRVLCKQTNRTGRWGPNKRALPRNRACQYLPAATFQGERLWVAAYVSNASTTRIVAIPRRRRGFARPVTLNSWPVPSDRVCAPHLGASCTQRQTFIGETSARSPPAGESWSPTSSPWWRLAATTGCSCPGSPSAAAPRARAKRLGPGPSSRTSTTSADSQQDCVRAVDPRPLLSCSYERSTNRRPDSRAESEGGSSGRRLGVPSRRRVTKISSRSRPRPARVRVVRRACRRLRRGVRVLAPQASKPLERRPQVVEAADGELAHHRHAVNDGIGPDPYMRRPRRQRLRRLQRVRRPGRLLPRRASRVRHSRADREVGRRGRRRAPARLMPAGAWACGGLRTACFGSPREQHFPARTV